MDDIILNKCETIERCVKRTKETYHGNEEKLIDDYDIQDIIVLNLQRACESAIDAAMHLIKIKKLGIPKDSRDAFTLLAKANLISRQLSAQLEKMVGFRNIIIHEYTNIDYDIVKTVLVHGTDALLSFTKTILILKTK